MKTINIIANYSSLYAGNFIPSLLTLAKGLQKNHKVVFSFPNQAKERFWCQKLQSEGFEVCFYGSRIIRDLKKINKSIDADILYTHFLSTPIVKLLSPFSQKKKLVIHVHSDFSGGKNKWSLSKSLKSLIFGHYLRRDTKYIYVSEELKKQESFKHSYYVRNALCTERIISAPFNKENFQVENRYDTDKVHFLMFGWSPFVKGVDTTINAFNNLPVEVKNKVQLILVHNYNKKEDIQKYIKENCSSVSFNLLLCNPVEDIFGLYKMNDVFISSSRSEGFSYSVLEALYNGLDVIVSNIPGTSWSKNYGAIPFNNEAELSKIICNFAAKSHLNKKINPQLVDDFSINKWVEQVTKIICDN